MASTISFACWASLPTFMMMLCKRVAAADLDRLRLAALEPLGEILVVVIAGLLADGLVDHGDVGGERRGRGEVAGAGLIGGRLQHGVAGAFLRHGIGEIVGGFGDELIDLVLLSAPLRPLAA